MKKNLAFTLTELLVALLVVGILAVIILSSVSKSRPNQNKIMMKKAFNVTSNAISDIINDATYYSNPNNKGFEEVNGIIIENEDKYNKTDTEYSGATKLPNLFLRYINTRGNVVKTEADSDTNCTGLSMKTDNHMEYCFQTTTKDGMTWNIAVPNYEFLQIENENEIIEYTKVVMQILVDVNANKMPNCYQGSDADACKDRKDYDQFRMSIYYDGSIEIDEDDVWAAEAIQVGSSLSSEN